MLNNTVIKVEDVSKQYRLGQVSTGTLSHDINRWWHKVRGKEVRTCVLAKQTTALQKERAIMYGRCVTLILM